MTRREAIFQIEKLDHGPGKKPVVVFEQEMTFFEYWVNLTAPFLFGFVYQELHEDLWYCTPDIGQV